MTVPYWTWSSHTDIFTFKLFQVTAVIMYWWASFLQCTLGSGMIHFRFRFQPKVPPYFRLTFGFSRKLYATFGHTFGFDWKWNFYFRPTCSCRHYFGEIKYENSDTKQQKWEVFNLSLWCIYSFATAPGMQCAWPIINKRSYRSVSASHIIFETTYCKMSSL